MRKKTIYILILTLFIFSGCFNDSEDDTISASNEEEVVNLKEIETPYKEYKMKYQELGENYNNENKYEYKEIINSNEETITKYEYEYNSENLNTTLFKYDIDTGKSKYEYTYNDNRKIIKAEYYEYNDEYNLISYFEVKYNENGLHIEVINYDSKENPEMKVITKYDELGLNVVETLQYEYNENKYELIEKITTEYEKNSEGIFIFIDNKQTKQWIKKEKYMIRGTYEKNMIYKYTWNSNNLLTVEIGYDNEGNVEEITQYNYDTQKRLIKEIHIIGGQVQTYDIYEYLGDSKTYSQVYHYNENYDPKLNTKYVEETEELEEGWFLYIKREYRYDNTKINNSISKNIKPTFEEIKKIIENSNSWKY